MTYLTILMCIFLLLLTILLLMSLYLFHYAICRKQWGLPKFLSKCIAGDTPDVVNKEQTAEIREITYYEQVALAEKKLLANTMEPLEQMSTDGLKLRGHLWRGDENCKKVILAVHGCRSSGITEFCFIAPYYHEKGYHVCLIDHRACGTSEGAYMGYGYLESQDMCVWIKRLVEIFGIECEIYLHGISMGAATVLMMSSMDLTQQVKGIIADCSYTSAWEEFAYQMKTSFHLPLFPLLHLTNIVCKLKAHYGFKQASPLDCVKHSKLPILFIHGGNDDFVPTHMVHTLYEACRSKKALLIIKDAVHARSFHTDSARYIDAIQQFIKEIDKERVQIEV